MSTVNISPDIQPRNQNKSSTCWLSCLEMMFHWKYKKCGEYTGPKLDWKYESCNGYDYTSEILWKMDASYSLNTEFIYKNGIAPAECRETARMLGLQPTGFDSTVEADFLQGMLRRQGPLWIGGMWISGRSHALVITGYNSDTRKVSYVNPWENYSLSESSGPLEWLLGRGSQWINCDASVMYWH